MELNLEGESGFDLHCPSSDASFSKTPKRDKKMGGCGSSKRDRAAKRNVEQEEGASIFNSRPQEPELYKEQAAIMTGDDSGIERFDGSWKNCFNQDFVIKNGVIQMGATRLEISDKGDHFEIDNGGAAHETWYLGKHKRQVIWSNTEMQTIKWFRTLYKQPLSALDGTWENDHDQRFEVRNGIVKLGNGRQRIFDDGSQYRLDSRPAWIMKKNQINVKWTDGKEEILWTRRKPEHLGGAAIPDDQDVSVCKGCTIS